MSSGKEIRTVWLGGCQAILYARFTRCGLRTRSLRMVRVEGPPGRPSSPTTGPELGPKLSALMGATLPGVRRDLQATGENEEGSQRMRRDRRRVGRDCPRVRRDCPRVRRATRRQGGPERATWQKGTPRMKGDLAVGGWSCCHLRQAEDREGGRDDRTV